jgi:hypothetical protein
LIVIVPLVCFALFCLTWPVFYPTPKPIVRPLTMDEQASQAIYQKADENKVKAMRHARRVQTDLWTHVNYPAACWERRKQAMLEAIKQARLEWDGDIAS